MLCKHMLSHVIRFHCSMACEIIHLFQGSFPPSEGSFHNDMVNITSLFSPTSKGPLHRCVACTTSLITSTSNNSLHIHVGEGMEDFAHSNLVPDPQPVALKFNVARR